MLRNILTFFLFAATAHAQDNVYGNFQRAVQKSRDDAAYLESLRSRPNNIPWVSGSGVDPKAVQELAARFSGKSSQTSASRPEVVKLTAEEAEAEAQYRREIEEWEHEQDIIDWRASILQKKWENRGVGYADLQHLTRACVSSDEDDNTVHMETTAGQAMRACALYQTLSKTGSYDELMECIIRMRPALLTSFNALDEMEARFPEHKAALDLCRMQWVTLYFGGSVDGSWPDTWAFDLNSEGANKQFLDAFKKIDDQYPKAALGIAGLMRERPYNMLAERCKKEKNLRGAAEYYFKAMQVSRAGMHQFNGRYVSGMSYILFYEADKFFRKNPKLLPLSTPEQWQSFAAIHGIPVRMALELAYGFDANTLATQYKSDKGRYYGNGYPEVIDKLKISDVLRQLADKGDPDAMNAMAVRYAAGVEGKAEDAIPLFRKAAEAGSLWAHVNLIQATYWGLKDYGPENRPTAKANLRKFLESASPDDILMAGKILENDANTARIYLETEDHIFSKELIKTAARLGQWNAAERVAYEKW